MAEPWGTEHWDVAVIGGGAAGIAAAVAAARNGARTVLVEAGPMIGGELLSGIPINACISTRGEWVVGGFARELVDLCGAMGGLVPPYFDWRALWLVCIDPEVAKLAVMKLVQEAGVNLLLYTYATDVVMGDGQVTGVVVVNKNRRTLLTAELFIDCSGDADITARAGYPWEKGGAQGEYQPVSMIFRMVGVEAEPLLQFVVERPENVALGEALLEPRPKQECAEALYNQGVPSVFFDGRGPLLADAVASGELHPCGILAVCPVSIRRKEVSLNTTRIADLDATDTQALSRALAPLLEQVWQCAGFLKRRIPGFADAHFSGIAPRIGIRETRRIVGETVLTAEDVLGGAKRRDGVCKGAHELDVHGAGAAHRREIVRNGGSYDIPFGCLLPKGSANLLVAGRCLSATREAHGSARVMGTCMGMGQAAGTAAAMCITEGTPLRQLSVDPLRSRLTAQGAVLDGTY